jgi:hypothetical protein
MTDVQFEEEDDFKIRRPVTELGNASAGGIIGTLIRMRVAKDQKQANQLLAAIGVCCVLLAAGVWYISTPHHTVPTGNQIQLGTPLEAPSVSTTH